MATTTQIQAPSLLLLRTFLRPSSLPYCFASQTRLASGWMPREKYAKITGLDKLHRRQRAARRQEKLDSVQRAKTMTMPNFLQDFDVSPSTTTTETETNLTPSQAAVALPSPPKSLPYLITRTRTRNLPIYESAKAGGNRHITSIRKITGDLDMLQSHIKDALKLQEYVEDQRGRKKDTVAVNRTTNQLVVRGWRGAEIKRWCEMVGF